MRVLFVLLLVGAGASAALAQGARQGTAQEQQACSRDASKFCRKDLGNDSAVQQNRAKLSAACKTVFQSHGQ